MRLVDYGCRVLLRLFPKDMRDAHGAEMRETLRAVSESRSVIPEFVDLATSAIKARAGFPRLPSGHRPQSPSSNGGGWMNAILSDLRQAVRALAARPGTTALAISLLALAIGACTAVFTVADAVLFTPVPYPNAERLVPIGIARQPGAWPSLNASPELIRAWQQSGAFERVEVHASTSGTTLDDGREPRSVSQSWITPGMLDVLGVAPIHGRGFTQADAEALVPPALISETLWRSHFGGEPSLVGRFVSIEGTQTEIVGIMPGDFRFPLGRKGFWRPLDIARGAAEKKAMWAIGLIRSGLPREEARRLAEEATRASVPSSLAPPASLAFAANLGTRSFDDYTVNAVKVLFAGVVLVLVVACINVANLLLAQALSRRRERAVRAALGASRARLVRQALCESFLLAACASLAGLLLAWLAVSSFERLVPEYMLTRGANGIDLDARAYGAVAVLAASVMLASGLLPAWFGTSVSAGGALKEDGRGATESRAARRLSSVLVVGEIAVAVALLLSASLLVRSFIQLATIDRGIDTRNIVSVWLSLPRYQESDTSRRLALADQVEANLSSVPGVARVLRVRGAPPQGGNLHMSALRSDDGRTVEGQEIFEFEATPAFFSFFGMRLAAGRFLTADDPDAAVVISERLARMLWPDDPQPIGRTFRIGREATLEVAGVSREMLTPLLDPRIDQPEFFRLARGPVISRYALRLHEDATVRMDAIRAAIRAVHPGYVVYEAEHLDALYREHIEGPESAAKVAGAFAAFGTIVCAAGLFSVLSLSVARRRREFGIRLAIGAHPSQLSRLVMRQTIAMLAAGIVLGIAGAFALARNLSSVLAGVSTTDISSWIIVVGLIAATGIAAAWLPVRDARRTDPLLLLREE